MDPLFRAIEETAFSVWLRDSPSLLALPFVLILHTVGLAFLVGTSVALASRTLGVAAAIPLGSLARYRQVLWAGFWLNAASGVALLVAYPTKALTNPLFFWKLALIVAALAALAPVLRSLARGNERDGRHDGDRGCPGCCGLRLYGLAGRHLVRLLPRMERSTGRPSRRHEW